MKNAFFGFLGVIAICLLLSAEHASAQNSNTCQSNSEYKCTLNAAISGHNTRPKPNAGSLEECQKLCTEETDFVCKSFDFNKSSKACDLSDKFAADVGGLKTDYSGNPYDYYERKNFPVTAPAHNGLPTEYVCLTRGQYHVRKLPTAAGTTNRWQELDQHGNVIGNFLETGQSGKLLFLISETSEQQILNIDSGTLFSVQNYADQPPVIRHKCDSGFRVISESGTENLEAPSKLTSISQAKGTLGNGVWATDEDNAVWIDNDSSDSFLGTRVKLSGRSLKQVSAVDNLTAVGVDVRGTVYKTLDGGNTWTSIPSALIFKYVSAVSSATFWGIVGSGDVYRFSNGNWIKIEGRLKQVSGVSGRIAWGVNSNDIVYRSSDGGRNWKRLPGSLKQVSAVNEYIAWGVNDSNQLYRTNDGGLTWDQVDRSAIKVSAISYHEVLIITESGSLGSVTKFIRQMPVGTQSFSAVGDEIAWRTSSNNAIFKTINSGTDWKRIESTPPTGLKQVSAVDKDIAWGLNKTGDLYRTTNGGADWTRFGNEPDDLIDVSAADKESAWVIDKAFKIHRVTEHSGQPMWRSLGKAELVNISAVDKKRFWGVNVKGNIYRYDEDKVSRDSDGFDRSTRDNGPGFVSHISAYGYDYAWVTTSDGKLFRTINSGKSWEQYDYAQKPYFVSSIGPSHAWVDKGKVFPHFFIEGESGNDASYHSTYPYSPKTWLTDVGANWMVYLDDSTRLYELSIPGTHDSAAHSRITTIGAAAKTQNWNIDQQLKAGIRYLDIRLRTVGSDLILHHGVIDLVQDFDQVMKTVTEFLDENPSEVILMRIKLDEADPQHDGDTAKVWASAYKKHQNWFATKKSSGNTINRNAAIGNLRKKIVILRDYSWSMNPDPQNVPGMSYPGSAGDQNITVQDYYQVYDVLHTPPLPKVSLRGKKDYVSEYIDTAVKGQSPIVINHLSGAVGLMPATVARHVNGAAYEKIKEMYGKHTLGVLVMDHPAEKLIYKIIQSNFELGGVKIHITSKTSDETNAGTDSNIKVTIYGNRGSSKPVTINPFMDGNAFETGDEDTTDLLYVKDFGYPNKLTVESDGLYAAPAWKPEYIGVWYKGRHYKFEFDRWIESSGGPYTSRYPDIVDP